MTQLARLDDARQAALSLRDADPSRFARVVLALGIPLGRIDQDGIDVVAQTLRQRTREAGLDGLLARPPRRRARGSV